MQDVPDLLGVIKRRVAKDPAKRISQRPKGYFADTGLAAWTQRISSPPALMSNPIQDALFETHVVLDLLKQAQTVSHPSRPHHWRAHSGAEVDLLLERDGMFIAVEAKSSTRVTRAFRETYPRLEHGIGVVVAAVRETALLDGDVIAVPRHRLTQQTTVRSLALPASLRSILQNLRFGYGEKRRWSHEAKTFASETLGSRNPAVMAVPYGLPGSRCHASQV